MRRAAVSIVLGAIYLAAASAQRQTPSAQPVPRFQTGVDLVLLDVSVLDDKRMPVRGLRPEDFTVLEDGSPQPIQTFSSIELSDVVENAPPPGTWLHDVVPDVQRNDDSAERRLVVVVLDDSTPMEAGEDPSVRRMARGVIEQLGPRDIASVVYTTEKGKGQEFTQDRTRLVASVNKFIGALPGAAPVDSFDASAQTGYGAVLGTLVTMCRPRCRAARTGRTPSFGS